MGLQANFSTLKTVPHFSYALQDEQRNVQIHLQLGVASNQLLAFQLD